MLAPVSIYLVSKYLLSQVLPSNIWLDLTLAKSESESTAKILHPINAQAGLALRPSPIINDKQIISSTSAPFICRRIHTGKARATTNSASVRMDIVSLQKQISFGIRQSSLAFQKVPGSAVLVRYIRSSYQNDPVRSAIELVLILFFFRYLLSPSYATHKQNFVKLREEVSTRLSVQ